MQTSRKQGASPYNSLIAFANEEITVENWGETLKKLSNRPFLRPWPDDPDKQNQAIQEWETAYKGLGFLALLPSKRITGPEPLQDVRQKLRRDLEQLTERKDQNVIWLLNRIMGFTGGILIQLTHINPKAGDCRVLSTGPVSFVPILTNLHQFVYFRLGKLWENGLLHRIGQCQNPKCRQFFLAMDERPDRRFCSRRCGQNATGPDRQKNYRNRMGKWEKEKKALGSLFDDINAIFRKRQLRQPRSERQVLEDAEKAFSRAQEVFKGSFPGRKGFKYAEGEAFLAAAKELILRLKKRVRG